VSFSRSYLITFSDAGEDGAVDDEAILDIEAVIETINRRHLEHLGQQISLRLLHSRRYGGKTEHEPSCFGSVTLRGQERSVLAYLPREPFWALPSVIESGASILEISFSRTSSGFGDLLSLNLAGSVTA
jgi:hypothetical protein